jgi:replicative DNA helicase
MSDLRESGRIEETAWIVMLLYRDDYYNPESEKPGELTVIVGKNKDGCTGEVNLIFNKKSLRIFEATLKLEREENNNYELPY